MRQADPRQERASKPEPKGLNVSLVQVMASALASVSAAVLASFFGVTGTIVGTALVSVVATTGSAVYALWLRRTHRRLRNLREQALTRYPYRQSHQVRGRAGAHPSPPVALGAPVATPADVHTAHEQRRQPPGSSWRERLRHLRIPVAAGVVAAFVLAAGVVTAVELIGNQPLAAMVNGTRGSGVSFGGGSTGPATTTTTSTTVAPGSATSTTTTPAVTTTVPAATTTTVPAATTTVPATTTTTPATSVPSTGSSAGGGSAGGGSAGANSAGANSAGGGSAPAGGSAGG